MHKIITKKYILNIVRENIGKVEDEILRRVLLEKNIPVSDNCSKDALIKMIDYHKINLWHIYELLKKKEFGSTYNEILEILNIEKEILDKLIEEGIIHLVYTKKESANSIEEKYYLLEDVYNLSKENLVKFREAQLKGKCKGYKCKKNRENHIKKAYKKRINDLRQNFSYWDGLIHKNNVIVSIVSTGIDTKRDEIIEMAVIDIKGDVIYHNTFKTNKRVSYESYAIKRIDKNSISKKRIFTDCVDEIYNILEDKTILAYNSTLVSNLLKGNGYVKEVDSVCLMKSYMDYVHSKYIIRFKRALNMHNIEESPHKSKALGECFDILELINSVRAECKEKMFEVIEDRQIN